MTTGASMVGDGARTTTRILTDLPALQAELAAGLHEAWSDLVQHDPHGMLFQSPGWCLPWYRCYRDEYHPHVILVSDETGLVGVVPLAVRRGTRALVFASGDVPDYCDVVARPEHRPSVVAALVRAYVAGDFPHPLRVGWIDPASPLPALLADACAAEGLRHIVRQQPCYRWFPPPPAKPSAQKFLKWYQRQGTVRFDVVEGEPEWQRFRDDYYRQHSLRQIQAGRPLAFHDARRRAFYDALFRSHEVQAHVTAFRVNGRLVAGHFGYVWRKVLLLGPPAIRLRDEQRSPAVVLFAWIIQNAERLGLAGFDLTIGDSDFKRRLGSECVTVTTVEIYRGRRAYVMQTARTRAVVAARGAVDRIGGEGTWKRRVKPAAEWLDYKRQRLGEMGLPAAARLALAGALRAVAERRTGLIYAMTPGELRPVEPKLAPGETFEVHDDCAEDLLRCTATTPSLSSLLTETARAFARSKEGEATLHTILLDGELAGWGWSYWPTGPAALSETPGAVMEFPPGSVSLYAFHTIPVFRGRRLYQALLTHILQARFAEGAARAYIGVLASNEASQTAIERVGFRLVRRNEYRRLLRRRSLRSIDVADG